MTLFYRELVKAGTGSISVLPSLCFGSGHLSTIIWYWFVWWWYDSVILVCMVVVWHNYTVQYDNHSFIYSALLWIIPLLRVTFFEKTPHSCSFWESRHYHRSFWINGSRVEAVWIQLTRLIQTGIGQLVVCSWPPYGEVVRFNSISRHSVDQICAWIKDRQRTEPWNPYPIMY